MVNSMNMQNSRPWRTAHTWSPLDRSMCIGWPEPKHGLDNFKIRSRAVKDSRAV